MAKITIDEGLCKGCSLCETACPKKILKLNVQRLNEKGYNPIALSDEEACIGCALCAIICPDCAITVN